MKSDNAIRNGTSIFVGIIVAIAAFVRGALLLPLLLVACSVWGLYVLQHLRGSLPEIPNDVFHGSDPVFFPLIHAAEGTAIMAASNGGLY